MGPKEGLSFHPARQVVLAEILPVLSPCMTKTSHCHYFFTLSLQILCRKQSGIFHQLERWGPLDSIPINVLNHKVF